MRSLDCTLTAPLASATLRGRGRPISSVLADVLSSRPESGAAAAAAAFAETLGWPLCREVQLRALTRQGVIIAVARSEAWAEQLRALAPSIIEGVNRRLRHRFAVALEVRVGPLDR